jgi:hypothetical protein
MTAHLLHHLADDTAWTRLAAAVLWTLGLALTIISATAWSSRHD